MKNKLCMIICSNYYNEIKKVIENMGYKNVLIKVYPAICTEYNKMKIDEIKKIIGNSEAKCSHFEIFCSCGCFNIDKIKKQLPNYKITDVNTCFNYLVNEGIINYYASSGNFIITPGWLNNWEKYVKDTWGFDKKTAHDFFKESASQLLLLDTGTYKDSIKKIEQLSNYVGLEFDIVPITLDHIAKTIEKMVTEFNSKTKNIEITKDLFLKNKQIADYGMVIDLFNNLTRVNNEERAVEEIFSLIKILFGAEIISFISIKNGNINFIKSQPITLNTSKLIEIYEDEFNEKYKWTKSGKGFFTKIFFDDEEVGIILIEQILFEKYIKESLNLFLNISNLCGLAIYNARNYSNLLEAKESLKKIAYYDNLTGLFNRRVFMERLEDEIINAERRNEVFAVVFIDLNKFKLTNDNYGHDIGDKLLIEVSNRLKTSLRKTDVIARMGGDEFTILLKNVKTKKYVMKIMDKILSDLMSQCVLNGISINISVSIGISLFPYDGKDLEVLMKKADIAMYKIKESGKSGFKLYSKNM